MVNELLSNNKELNRNYILEQSKAIGKDRYSMVHPMETYPY